MWYDDVSADTKCGSSCTLAIWVLKLIHPVDVPNKVRFLYARYMGIETFSLSDFLENLLGSCTLAIWVLKLFVIKQRIDNAPSSCTLAIWVLKLAKPRGCVYFRFLYARYTGIK